MKLILFHHVPTIVGVERGLVIDGARNAPAHGIVAIIDCDPCAAAVKPAQARELVFLVVGVNRAVDGGEMFGSKNRPDSDSPVHFSPL